MRGAAIRARASDVAASEVLASPFSTAAMYVLQPLARLVGRLQLGLTPWRRRGVLRAGLRVAAHDPELEHGTGGPLRFGWRTSRQRYARTA